MQSFSMMSAISCISLSENIFFKHHLPCIACMQAEGNLEMKSIGIDVADPNKKYDRKDAE